MSTPTLFAECVLPGCRNPVDRVGTPCGDCRTAFGDQLREIPRGTPMTADQISARDEGTQAANVAMAQIAAAAEPERKRNQVCWLCEERHTCTLIAGRWECDTCKEVV